MNKERRLFLAILARAIAASFLPVGTSRGDDDGGGESGDSSSGPSWNDSDESFGDFQKSLTHDSGFEWSKSLGRGVFLTEQQPSTLQALGGMCVLGTSQVAQSGLADLLMSNVSQAGADNATPLVRRPGTDISPWDRQFQLASDPPIRSDPLGNAIIGGLGNVAVRAVTSWVAGIIESTTADVGEATTALVPYYPANQGFTGSPAYEVLGPGTVVTRYGPSTGSYLTEGGTPAEWLSLPPSTASIPYGTNYVVGQPFPVLSGTAAPWAAFGSGGGGTQFVAPATIQWLLDNGFLQ